MSSAKPAALFEAGIDLRERYTMAIEKKNGLLASVIPVALAALVISGCSAKKTAESPVATPTSGAAPAATRSATATVPANERPFVPPPSVQGPQSGAQFVTRNGQLPPNGSEP